MIRVRLLLGSEACKGRTRLEDDNTRLSGDGVHAHVGRLWLGWRVITGLAHEQERLSPGLFHLFAAAHADDAEYHVCLIGDGRSGDKAVVNVNNSLGNVTVVL